MIHAYGADRAILRKTKKGLVRHAVDEISHLCGAHDTLCGVPVVVRLGPWVPDDADNCKRCARAVLAEQGAS